MREFPPHRPPTQPLTNRHVLVEAWQANTAGRYNHPADKQDKSLDRGFRGWARTGRIFNEIQEMEKRRRRITDGDHSARQALAPQFHRRRGAREAAP
jgi:hypothetical protein